MAQKVWRDLEAVVRVYGKFDTRSVEDAISRNILTFPAAASPTRSVSLIRVAGSNEITTSARTPLSRWAPVEPFGPGVRMEPMRRHDASPVPILRMASALVPGLWLAFAPGHLVMLGVFETPVGSNQGSTSADVLYALKWLPDVPAYGWFVRARNAVHPSWRLDLIGEALLVPGISQDTLDGRAKMVVKEAMTGFLGYSARLRAGVGALHGIFIAWRGTLFGMLQDLIPPLRDETSTTGSGFTPMPNRGVPIYGDVIATPRRSGTARGLPCRACMRVVMVTHPGVWHGHARLTEVAPPAG